MNNPAPTSGISISYPAAFYEFLKELGLAVDNLYKEVQIDTDWFNEPDRKISVQQYVALSKKGLALSQFPDLGLRFGTSLSLQSHNYLGFALQSSRNGEEAIRLASQYIGIRFPSINLIFKEEDEFAVLLLEDKLCEPDLHSYNLEVFVATIYKGTLSLQLMDRVEKKDTLLEESTLKTAIIEIQFEFPEPNYVQAYYDSFPGIKLTFNQNTTQVILNKKTLKRPYSFGNPISLKLAEDQCHAELTALSSNESITAKIHRILFSDVSRFPTLDAIAKHLHMSPRALSRRLKDEDTTYQAILDNVRKQLSIKYLETTDLDIAEIAYRLNFEHPTNFTRAFKKWTNKSPSDYRP